jgi:tetratricopeptide (TPR) repeat protein
MGTPMSIPRRTVSRRLIAGVVLLALAAVAGIIVVRQLEDEPQPPKPPNPDLTQVDPAVREVISNAQADVRKAPQSAVAWGRLGMAFHAHIFAGEAMTCFERAEKVDPTNPRWPYFQGLILLAHDPPAALPKIERAVELCGDREDAPRLRLAELYQRLGQHDAAMEQFGRLVVEYPTHPRVNLGLARLYAQDGNLTGSRDRLRHAMDHPATRKSALTLSAELHQRQGDSRAARQDRAAAAELPDESDWPDTYVNETAPFQVGAAARLKLAGQLLDRNRGGEASRMLDELVRDYPQSGLGWTLLGWAQLQQNQSAAAENSLQTALKLDRAQPRTWLYLGVAQQNQKKRAEAIDSFRQAIELKPSYFEAHYNLGVCLKEANDLDEAANAFEDALRCQPLSAPAHAQLGEVLWKRGKATEAREHLEQAAELNPKDAAVRKLLDETRGTRTK